jgi:hypothetical protein
VSSLGLYKSVEGGVDLITRYQVVTDLFVQGNDFGAGWLILKHLLYLLYTVLLLLRVH